jgi:glutamine amidotransferase
VKNIVIIDYGVGNLKSLKRAFVESGSEPIISEDSKLIAAADALVLPGVGAFSAGMHGLAERGLVEVVRNFAASGKPMLGICLGAQLLFSEGQELGIFNGLGSIPGKVVAFPPLKDNEKVPHMGWNTLRPSAGQNWEGTILSGLDAGVYAYFVHSYIMEPQQENVVLATTTYGGCTFPAVVRQGSIYGVQFHPEKSATDGLAMIKNFIALVSVN